MTLSIIPGIYLYINNKGVTKQKLKVNKKLLYDKEYYSNYNSKAIKIKKLLIILLSAFLDFLQKFLVFLFTGMITNNVWIFNIIFLNIFSICILKTKLYYHQIFTSSIIIFLGLILNGFLLYDMETDDIDGLLLSIFIEITYSLCIVVNKYGIDHCFCSPIEISFYEGLFELIINSIFLAIATNIEIDENSKLFKHTKHVKYDNKTYIDNWYAYYDVFKGKEIVMFIITMLSRWIFNLFSLIVIKYYTASHVIFLLVLGEMQNAFIDIDSPTLKYLAIIVYCAILLLLIIFTEIIILNFWGCEKNTKIYIAQRALSKEIEETLTGEDYNEKDSNFDIEIEDGIEIHITKF